MADSSDDKSQGKTWNSAQRTPDGALDSLSRKALQIAESSDDADEILKAFRLYQAVDRQKQKEAAKTRSRGALQMARIIAPYTAIIALLVSVGTLAFRFWQVRTTEEDKERNAEKTQWREALRNLSTKDDSAVFSGVLGMQTFFESPQYAAQSRSSAVALLPLLGDGSEFDTVWEGMLEQTNEHNQMDLVSVGRSVAAEEYELFRQITGTTFPLARAGQRDFVDFVVDPDRPERDWANPTNASSSPPPLDISSTWSALPESWSTKTTTVKTTDFVTSVVSTVVYTYSSFAAPTQPNDTSDFDQQIPVEQSVQCKESTGSVLRTVTKTWSDPFELTSEQTNLEDGSTTSKTTYTYGPGAQLVLTLAVGR